MQLQAVNYELFPVTQRIWCTVVGPLAPSLQLSVRLSRSLTRASALSLALRGSQRGCRHLSLDLSQFLLMVIFFLAPLSLAAFPKYPS